MRRPSRAVFLAAFAVAALLLAGLVSYLASPAPDGLDTVTRDGCAVTEDGRLDGRCMAQTAEEHDLADGPFAGYAVGGADALRGVAGVIGVAVTLAMAGGLFWLLRRRSARTTER